MLIPGLFSLFEKLKGQNSSPFSKLKQNSMYRRFFNQIFWKKTLCGKFCLQNLKVMLKTATFWCKKHFLWLKINIYLWNLAIFIPKLKYFPQNSTFFQTEGKNSRKIQNSRQKLNENSKLKAETQRFWHKNSRYRRFLPLEAPRKSHKKAWASSQMLLAWTWHRWLEGFLSELSNREIFNQ